MEYAYGNWLLVVGISVLFLWFTFDAFKPKTRTDWKSYGLFGAFIVALFTEMYGFPLTMYLLASWFGSRFPQLNFSHTSGHLWEVLLDNTADPHWSVLHIVSNVFILGGLLLISSAWKVLYQAIQKKTLATTGAYRYIRHPQYSGFILIIIGFLLQWPTIITLLMAPLLIWRYVKLAHHEERLLRAADPVYDAYASVTPAWIPSLKTLTRFIVHNKKGGEIQYGKKQSVS